ncbi:MAG: diacylglycerol/lipid kinase family protein [Patescibacteria group bacterium]
MFVLCNPEAGARSKADTYKLAQTLQKEFPKVFVSVVPTREEFKKLLEQMSENTDKIIVMGGDGTVNLACQVLANTNTSLGIIPTGRGNDFANGLGLPKDPVKALKLALQGKPESVDLGKVNDRYFCNSFGIGFDAKAIRFSENYKKEAWKELFSFHNFPIKGDLYFNSEKESVIEDALMVTFANGKTEGGGITINKDSSFHDHQLGITIVKRMNKPARLFSFLLFYSKLFDYSENVSHQKIRNADLEVLKSVRMHIDGEVFFSKKINVEICPDALKVIAT